MLSYCKAQSTYLSSTQNQVIIGVENISGDDINHLDTPIALCYDNSLNRLFIIEQSAGIRYVTVSPFSAESSINTITGMRDLR